MRTIFIACLFAGVILVGCSPRYPVTKVNAVDARPTISFTNIQQGSVLMVDGINMGEVAQYDGKPKVLTIEAGTHDISISKDNATIFEQTIFVESEHKTINIR